MSSKQPPYVDGNYLVYYRKIVDDKITRGIVKPENIMSIIQCNRGQVRMSVHTSHGEAWRYGLGNERRYLAALVGQRGLCNHMKVLMKGQNHEDREASTR